MFLPCPCPCENVCNVSGSIVWARTGTGYRIENLQKKHFNLAIILIKQYYFQNDVLLNALGTANDIRSVTNLLIHVLKIMSTGSSLVLIDDRDDTIAGILLLSTVDKMNFGRVFSHPNLQHGKAYEDCMAIRNHMHKKLDFFLDYNVDVLMRFYLLCIADEHRGQQLGFHLFRIGMEVARHLHVPIACGVFTSEDSQKLAKKVGFEIVDSINYTDWFIPDGDKVFAAPDERHFVALMVAKVPPFYISDIIYGMGDKKKEKKGKKDKKKKGKKKK